MDKATDKDNPSQARRPGPNDVTDDIGNVVGNKRGGAPPDRAPRELTPDEVAMATSRDGDPRREQAEPREHRESPGSADTGRKGGSSIEYKMYPRPGRSSPP